MMRCAPFLAFFALLPTAFALELSQTSISTTSTVEAEVRTNIQLETTTEDRALEEVEFNYTKVETMEDNSDDIAVQEVETADTDKGIDGEAKGEVEATRKIGEGEKGGDPDQPVITGRVYNNKETVEEDTTPVMVKGKTILENVVSEESAVETVEVRGWDPEKKKGIVGENEAAAAKKLKEIVVVGNPGEEIDKATPKIFKSICNNHEDLKNNAEYLAANDKNIQRIVINDDGVTLSYAQRAKLFGFFDITYNLKTTVDKEGRVKVKFHWVRLFAKDNAKEVGAAIQEAMGTEVQENMYQQQSHTLQTMSNVSKTMYDAGMAVIRKIGG